MGSLLDENLPDSNSPDLYLSHPTPDECVKIWTNTSASWKDSLTVPIYLKESLYLTTVPLAKDGGMSTWILVDKNLPPNERPILCSCESFRKQALTSDAAGDVSDTIVHGIASVFCPPAYRRRGYAARMMKDLAKALHGWQSEQAKVVGSVLYSDIGTTYYADLGWKPNRTNSHVVLSPIAMPKPPLAKEILADEIAELCKRDEVMLRGAMATPMERIKTRMTIIPDFDHMFWHIRKEDFACDYNFGKKPRVKGAIAGPLGSQIWAIWAHRYYGPPNIPNSHNVLYILRLVVENEEKHHGQTDYLKAILQSAQAEAAEWKLDYVKLWEPTPLVHDMIRQSDIEHLVVEREEDSIASGLWYDENGNIGEAPLWINNEHYAWC